MFGSEREEPAEQHDDPAAAHSAKPLSNLQSFLLGRLSPQPVQSFEEVMRDGPLRDARFGINSQARNAQRKHESLYFRGRKI